MGAGQFHSFAVQQNGNVDSWGLDNFGQIGQPLRLDEGDSNAHLPKNGGITATDWQNHFCHRRVIITPFTGDHRRWRVA